MKMVIGRYEVIDELGRGAMGVVYRATDPIIGRVIALKTIRNADGLPEQVYKEMSERFLREARAAGRLQHPNIVTILDAGTDEASGISFIAMELITGRDLDEALRDGRRFTTEEAVAIIAAAARGLEYAHENGVVHRDVKPGNILLDDADNVKVTDFGIAHIAESGLTRTGQVIGSPAYMSPEQIAGTAVDRRSDIFSLGVVFYQLLTGERPFQGEGLTSLAYQIVHTEPIPVGKINPALPAKYGSIVAAALVKDRERRYQTAAAFASDLVGETSFHETMTGTETMALDSAADLSGGTLLNAPAGTGTVIGTPTSGVGPGAGAPAPAGGGRPAWLLPAAVAFAAIVVAGAVIFGPGGATESKPGATEVVTDLGTGGSSSLPPGAGLPAAGVPAAPQPTVTMRAATPTPEPAAGTPAAVPRENPAAVATPENARLLIDFEHFLASGTIWIKIDDELVFKSRLAAKEKKKFGLSQLKLAKEHIREEISVPSGKRTVTIEVKSGDGTVNGRKEVRTTLRTEYTNILDIGISRFNKGITLELKP